MARSFLALAALLAVVSVCLVGCEAALSAQDVVSRIDTITQKC
jgi:hypothetical protein